MPLLGIWYSWQLYWMPYWRHGCGSATQSNAHEGHASAQLQFQTDELELWAVGKYPQAEECPSQRQEQASNPQSFPARAGIIIPLPVNYDRSGGLWHHQPASFLWQIRVFLKENQLMAKSAMFWFRLDAATATMCTASQSLIPAQLRASTISWVMFCLR